MKEMTIKRMPNEPGLDIRDGHTLLDLARGWLKQGNPVVAMELLKPAILSVEADRDQKLRAQILKETGRAKMMLSDWESSEEQFLEAQRVFLDIEDLQGAAECARNRANMNFQQGNYTVSADLCEQALEWASTIKNYELRATILNTMGAVNSAIGNIHEAIKTFRLCLSDFESTGNSLRQGYVLLNIGLAHIELVEHNQAMDALNRALAIALNERDLHLVEICYQNISKCYLEQKDIVLARSVLDTARRILPGLNSKGLECELGLIEIRIFRISGDLDKAELMLQKYYRIASENHLTALVPELLFEMGLVAMDQGNFALSRAKFDAAANQYKAIGVDKGFQEAIEMLKQSSRRCRA